MADAKGPAGGLAEGVSSVFNQLGQFFHIFDLSFFASGAATIGAVAFATAVFKPEVPKDLPPWAWVAVFVLGSYIAGVASFAVGRMVRFRSPWRRKLHEPMKRLFESHGLWGDEPAIRAYFDQGLSVDEQNEQAFRLYSRLWAELRDDYSSSESFRVLNRYWVTAAMYDGLIVSFIAWAGIFLLIAGREGLADRWTECTLFALAAAMCGVLSLACYTEGYRNFRYQVTELIATFAYLKKKIAPARLLTAPAK